MEEVLATLGHKTGPDGRLAQGSGSVTGEVVIDVVLGTPKASKCRDRKDDAATEFDEGFGVSRRGG